MEAQLIKGDKVIMSGKYTGVVGVLDWIGSEGSMVKTNCGDFIPVTDNRILKKFVDGMPTNKKDAIIHKLKKKQEIKNRLKKQK